MAEKVQKVGVERVQGFLYYIDKQGDVSRAKMARGGKKGGKTEKVEGRHQEAGRLPVLLGQEGRYLPREDGERVIHIL